MDVPYDYHYGEICGNATPSQTSDNNALLGNDKTNEQGVLVDYNLVIAHHAVIITSIIHTKMMTWLKLHKRDTYFQVSPCYFFLRK